MAESSHYVDGWRIVILTGARLKIVPVTADRTLPHIDSPSPPVCVTAGSAVKLDIFGTMGLTHGPRLQVGRVQSRQQVAAARRLFSAADVKRGSKETKRKKQAQVGGSVSMQQQSSAGA
jgi:hypothetical protein